MGILVGFNGGPVSWSQSAADKKAIDRARAKALFWSYVLCASATVAFTLQIIGCLTDVMRFAYLADFRGLRFAWFGICNNAGAQKCTPSLLKMSFEVALDIGSSQNTVADVQRLQNDITFAPSALAMFALLIMELWMVFYDSEVHHHLYYVWWFSMGWVTTVILGFNAAWMNTFGPTTLKHSQALANTQVSIGIFYASMSWAEFATILGAALICISWACDMADKTTTKKRDEWKKPYLLTLAPKSEVRMKVVQKYEKDEDAKK